jgi:hypothetical protein
MRRGVEMKRTVVFMLLLALTMSVAGVSGVGHRIRDASAAPIASHCEANGTQTHKNPGGYGFECKLKYTGPRLNVAGVGTITSGEVRIRVSIYWEAQQAFLFDCVGELSPEITFCRGSKIIGGRTPPVGTVVVCTAVIFHVNQRKAASSIYGLCSTADL